MSEPTITPFIQKGSFFRTGQQLGWSFINPCDCLQEEQSCFCDEVRGWGEFLRTA